MTIHKPNLQIAIDGPVAAGKGTVSRLLAESLDILYVDTGAMYRALTLLLQENAISLDPDDRVCKFLTHQVPKIDLRKPEGHEKDGRLITVLLDDCDVSWQIRTEAVSNGVSVITRYACVRDYMVPQQQALADRRSVVMEGRDITTRVLPQADLKIYLDASEQVRVKRRFQQCLVKGELVKEAQVKRDLHERDERDMHRTLDPLVKAPDAWFLDTSTLTIPEVVAAIIKRLTKMRLIEN